MPATKTARRRAARATYKPVIHIESKPRLYGPGNKFFCSRRCGANCTREAFLKAQDEAKQVAEQLGPGWTAGVFDNLAWFWHVYYGTDSIGITFSALRHGTVKYMLIDNTFSQTVLYGNSPKRMLLQLQRRMQKRLDAITAMTTEFLKVGRDV